MLTELPLADTAEMGCHGKDRAEVTDVAEPIEWSPTESPTQ